MTPQQISQLEEITGAILAGAQAQMARVQKQEADLRQQLQELVSARQNQIDGESPAQRAGADVRWQQWVDSRREQINIELARILATKETVRARLRIAFGKDQAMQALAKKVAARSR